MAKRFLSFVILLVCFGWALPADASFRDIKIDLTNGNLLTSDEIAGKTSVSFGVAVADDGTQTRVEAGDASANIVLTGKFHSNEHGWGNFSSTVAVEGPVKISMGTCAWGGDVTVKNAAGEVVAKFNTNTGVCYHNDKTANIASAYYKGTEATTLTISGGSYTPYIAVEKADPSELADEATVTFSLGDITAEGDLLPEPQKVEVDSKVTIPANRTLYIAGKTLTGWTDGTAVYAIGEELVVSKDVTLTPVFTDNTVAVADRTEPVALKWDFQRQNGAPLMSYQNKTGIYVTQAVVNGQTIDVKLDFDTNNGGKIANGSWTDWCQMNSGTKLTVASCKGAVVSLEAYSAITTTTIDGQTDYTHANAISYTIANTAETIDIVIGDGSYYRYVNVVLPVLASGGKTYTDEAASVVWNFNTSDDFVMANTVAPADGFSSAVANIGDLEVTGTATGQAKDADGNLVTFLKLKPSGSTKAAEWTVKPSKGLVFTPTKVSAYIQRFGTDAENGVVVTAILADGTQETLGTFTAPRANHDKNKDKFGNKDNYTNQFVIELTEAQKAKFASAGGFTLSATVGVGSTKEGGFSDVRIEGVLNGTVENVAKYTLATVVSPEDAGKVNIYPSGTEFEEGTEVKLTAVKNFGYKFVNWTDASGSVVSEQEQFTYVMTSDTELTANFSKLNTYSLDITVLKPANGYMVTAVPEPVTVDGKSMYEEGTNVTLTATGNKIMTFTNWSNGETSNTISVLMNQDRALTASFSAVDFIAGWDFILRGNDGRVADFAAAENDAVSLVLRNEAGETSGWLDKSYEADNNGYEGGFCAVNWRTTGLGDYYWQTMVNAEAFTDIKVSSAMLYNYNAYTVYNVEYSLDGNDWTKLGSIKIEGRKNWKEEEFALPEAANNKKSVYIRWIADKTSDIDGTTSDNDGIAISKIFITGTEKLVNDGKAPVLVSTVPENGNANASANGKIILTFDEKVTVAKDVKATLVAKNGTGEMELSPIVSGKTVIFEYKGLEYSTEYVFTLPARSVSDLTENATENEVVISFATKTRPAVAKALYDFIVPDDGDFKAAIAAAAKRSDNSVRFRIFIKQGAYTIPASETETVTGCDGVAYPSPITYVTSPNISIIGEGMDNTSVVNVLPDVEVTGDYGPKNPIEGLHNNQVIDLGKAAVNTYIQDITIKNGMKDSRGRNAALEDNSNKTICKNVCLHGYQDTYLSNNQNGRFYFENGRLRGCTDFLCGKGDVYYNGVNLVICGNGYIAVPSTPKQYGYIFRDCEINGEKSDLNGKYTLGRPWGSGTPIALFINTRMNVQPSAVGWNEMSGGWPARFAEYNSVTANGTAISLDNRKKIFGDGHENNPVLSAAEAAQMTIATVMGAGDDWDPTAATEQASAPKNVILKGNELTWDNSDYALCWAICENGKVIAFTTENAYRVDNTELKYSVRAANEMGGLGEATEATVLSGISNVGNTVGTVRTMYYNMQGIRVSESYKGTVVKVQVMNDGSKTVVKQNMK